jgi:hypothetical protein
MKLDNFATTVKHRASILNQHQLDKLETLRRSTVDLTLRDPSVALDLVWPRQARIR